MSDIADRFYQKVSVIAGGCHLWAARCDRHGYGYFYVGDKKQLAHRVAWQFANGPIPDGMCVCHRCDVRDCVNPEHLFLGTNLDNVRDRIAKGRLRSKTGIRGVYHRRRQFDAAIYHGRKQIYLGAFPTLEAAHHAYEAAARQMEEA